MLRANETKTSLLTACTGICLLVAASCYSPDRDLLEPGKVVGGAGGDGDAGSTGLGGTADELPEVPMAGAAGAAGTGGDPTPDSPGAGGDGTAGTAAGAPAAPEAPLAPGAPGATDEAARWALPCDSAVEAPIAPCPLPRPCAGVEYAVQLRDPSAGNYRLVATELPPGLELDTQTRTLSGVLRAPGSLGLRVEDAEGNLVEQLSFEVEARTSCWFGYVSTQTGPSLVHLVDPVLGTRVSLPASDMADTNVADFAFSADGRFLALSTVAGNGERRLRLFAAPSWNELSIDVASSVTGYVWAEHAALLAFTLRTDQGSSLGSVQLPVGLVVLQAAPEAIDSPLTWLGDSGVAYDAVAVDTAPEDGIRTIRHARWTSDGFATISVNERADYTRGLQMFGASDGFFVVAASAAMHFYDSSFEDLVWLKHQPSLISPSHRYAARSSAEGRLEVFRGTERRTDAGGFAMVLAEAAGCERLLAWSAIGEKLACVANDDVGGAVRVFELNESQAVLTSQLVRGGYQARYTTNEAFSRRRAFSPRSNWLALVGSNELYLADLRTTPFIQERSEPLLGTGEVNLEFSPDETLLALQRGTFLYLASVDPALDIALVARQLVSPAACSDDEAVAASPETWCGARGNGPVVWSPTSRALAFATSAGELYMLTWNDFGSIDDPLVCASGCPRDGFLFQPAGPATD